MNNKPPKSSIKTLIRRAIDNRYGINASISRDGKVIAGTMGLAPVSEWYTTRSDAGNVRLYQHHILMYTFSPEV